MSTQMLLAAMRRKRFNQRARIPGEPAIFLPKGSVLTTQGAAEQGGGLMLLRASDLIKLVDEYLRSE